MSCHPPKLQGKEAERPTGERQSVRQAPLLTLSCAFWPFRLLPRPVHSGFVSRSSCSTSAFASIRKFSWEHLLRFVYCSRFRTFPSRHAGRFLGSPNITSLSRGVVCQIRLHTPCAASISLILKGGITQQGLMLVSESMDGGRPPRACCAAQFTEKRQRDSGCRRMIAKFGWPSD
jgi:hypothetical protein